MSQKYLIHISEQAEAFREKPETESDWRDGAKLKQGEQEYDRYSRQEEAPQIIHKIKRQEPSETCCQYCGGDLDDPREVSVEQLELATARMLTGKYYEHLLLYRQSEVFSPSGSWTGSSITLQLNWGMLESYSSAEWRLYNYVMNTRKVHTDDTSVKVLAPGRKRQKQGTYELMSMMIEIPVRIFPGAKVRVLTGPAGILPGATP